MPVSSAALRACALLLCLVTGSRQLSIKEFVVPKSIEVGKDAELRCQYELEGNETEEAIYVKWWWTPGTGNGDEPWQLYQRIGGHDAQAIHHNTISQIEIKGNDSIILQDVHPVDSGAYGCEVTHIDIELRKHENLTVFSMGTGPSINYTYIKGEAEGEEDMLLIECAAEDVAPFPDMSIAFQGETINTTSLVEDISENGMFKISVNTTVSITDVNDGNIRCELTYLSLEHPPYVDEKKYVPAGRDAPPSTEPPADKTEPDPTHNSLQNPSNDGIRLHCSWALLTLAAVVTHLQATF